MSSHCVSGRAGGRAGILRAPGCRRAQRGGLGASGRKNYSGFLAFLQAVPVAIRASLVVPGTGLAAQKVSLFRGGAAGCCCLGEVGGSEMLRVPRCCVALVPAEPGESQQETQEAEKDDEGQVALEGRPRRLQNLLVHVHGGKYRDVVGVVLDGCVQVIAKTRCVVI